MAEVFDGIYDAGYNEIQNFGYNRMMDLYVKNPDSNLEDLWETEEMNRCMSPNEFWISDLNKRVDAEDAWEALESGMGQAYENILTIHHKTTNDYDDEEE